MVRVKDKLRHAGYKLWMDVERMCIIYIYMLSLVDGRRVWPLLVSSVPMLDKGLQNLSTF